LFKRKDNGWLAIQWITFCPVNNSCVKAIETKNLKKGLLISATFQVIFQAIQCICCDLQIIYDQSFCYLCVGAGNLCLHGIVFKIMYAGMVIKFLLAKL
jgi:hypothetical protein